MGLTSASSTSAPAAASTPASPPVPGAHALTPREREVYGWLVRGYSLATIARELGVSRGTVDTHVRHIYQKLGIHTREELHRLAEGRPSAPGTRNQAGEGKR